MRPRRRRLHYHTTCNHGLLLLETPAFLFALLAAIFLILNLRAYYSYFQDDDLDTLTWAPYVRSWDFLTFAASPRFCLSNFRPVGAYYYHVVSLLFPLDFPKFILPLQLAQLLNAWLLWNIIRKLRLDISAAVVGVLFYLFHAALLDAYWKPMYVFDLFCTTLCLLSFLCWLHNRLILSFVAFWLAYRAKELAVMLPLVLVSYEYLLGQRRWKQLLAFFAVSLSFGLQGILLNPNKGETNEYVLRFTFSALRTTSSFYASALFLFPFGGFLLIPVSLLVRDRRLWLGLISTLVFLAPLLFLPGRLYAVYWCLPLTGVAIALAAGATHNKRIASLLLILWLPWTLVHLRHSQRENLRLASGNQAFVERVFECARLAPKQMTFVYDGVPEGFHSWGVAGAIRCAYRRKDQVILWIDAPGARDLVRTGEAILFHWDHTSPQLRIVRNAPLAKKPTS